MSGVLEVEEAVLILSGSEVKGRVQQTRQARPAARPDAQEVWGILSEAAEVAQAAFRPSPRHFPIQLFQPLEARRQPQWA